MEFRKRALGMCGARFAVCLAYHNNLQKKARRIDSDVNKRHRGKRRRERERERERENREGWRRIGGRKKREKDGTNRRWLNIKCLLA